MKKLFLLFSISFISTACFAGYDYEFEFSGVIDEILQNDNDTIPEIIVGQQFNGGFSYSAVSDNYPTIDYRGSYHQTASFWVILGQTTYYHYDAYTYIRTYNNFGNIIDEFSFAIDDNINNSINVTSLGFILTDSTGTVFDNDSLPGSFDLSKFDSKVFAMSGGKSINNEYSFIKIIGTIDEITPVPEPASLVLLLIGGLAVKRRR